MSLGDKLTAGSPLGTTVVRLHVREKIPKKHLRKAEIFPSEIDGVTLDVVERCYSTQRLAREERQLRRSYPVDPLQPGVGISPAGPLQGSGTLGMVVFDDRDGSAGLLTAWHVLAASPTAAKGDPVLQPAPAAEGEPGLHTIARLRRWVAPMDGIGDAAFAAFTGLRSINPVPLGAARVTGARMPVQGELLEKSGRSTGVTRGRVESFDGETDVHYRVLGRTWTLPGFEIRFEPEGSAADRVSRVGDSGAVWLDPATGEAVGLHVGGDPSGRALACFLPDILAELEVSPTPTERTGDFRHSDDPAAIVPSFG